MTRASSIIAGVVRAVMKPRPVQKVWEWIDQNVVIPVIAGAVNPGPLRTHRFPIYRGLWDLYWQSRVRTFTLCKSARVGGTLFAICCVLHKIDIWPQAILWVDPTRKTARDFSRSELHPFIRGCKPVSEQAVYGEKTFTTLMMQFKGCILRLAGSGSAAELGGFQAEMVVLNERDKLKDKFDRESSSADLAKVRSKQFHQTRKILENSTPTVDTADTWQEFLKGSQHYCYVPCPHCSEEANQESRKAGNGVVVSPSGGVEAGARLANSQACEKAGELDAATLLSQGTERHANDGYPVQSVTVAGPGANSGSSAPPAHSAAAGGTTSVSSKDGREPVPPISLRGYQRLTFFSEEKDVPFDESGRPLPAGETRLEKTGRVKFEQFKRWHERHSTSGEIEKIDGGYDLEAVEVGATYQCAHCQKDIEHVELNWMLSHAATADAWRAHNPKAPVDHISAHVSALYSPFETWGQLAKKFLQARGSVKKLHDFYNADLGLPFVRYATTIKETDIDRCVKRCPRPYVLRELPLEPEMLTMTVDLGGEASGNFWFSIKAWGVLWDHSDRPIWCATIDCGPAVSWDQIEELAGIKPDRDGQYNRYRWKCAAPIGGTTSVSSTRRGDSPDGREPVPPGRKAAPEIHEYQVTAGLIDSGFEAQQNKKVYEFCLKNAHIFSPSKGGSRQHLRGKIVTTSPVWDEKLELVWYFDDWFKQQLYYHHIKEQKSLWWLPVNLEKEYFEHLTAEFTKEENGKLVWDVEGRCDLADTEKLHEVLREEVENRLRAIIDERDAAEAKEEQKSDE